MKAFMSAAGAAAALCVAAIASPASAGTFVFDVRVTGYYDANGAYTSITPITFQQTWSSNPQFGPINPISGSFYSALETRTGNTPASFGSNPLLDEVIGLSGFSAVPAFSYVHGWLQSYDYTPSSGSQDTNIRNVVFQAGRTVSSGGAYRTWEIGMHGTGRLFPFGPITQPTDFEQYLAEVGELSFFMTGANITRDNNGVYVGPYRNYQGVARLNQALTVVPEPSTWALMIGGLGLAGTLLRRRRSLAG